MKPSEKSKNTNELMQILSSAKTPEELQAYTETLKQEHISCSFVDFISEKLRERELSAADLIRNSMIQRNYGYQLLNGTRTPSRDKVLAFCLAPACIKLCRNRSALSQKQKRFRSALCNQKESLCYGNK